MSSSKKSQFLKILSQPATAQATIWGLTLGEWLIVPLLSCIFLLQPPGATDFSQFYYAAAAWPHPYQGAPLIPMGDGYANIFVPWAAVLALPVSFLPFRLALAILQSCNVLALHLLAGRVFWKTVVVCTSTVGLIQIGKGNLDAIAGLGALLPGGGAFMLLAMKPQTAGLASLPILLRDGWKQALLPALVIVIATLHWPEWLYRATLASQGGWNWSIFPWGVPIALLLVIRACQKRDPVLGAIATPFASPYVTLIALAPILALVFRRWPYLGGLLWLASWTIIF